MSIQKALNFDSEELLQLFLLWRHEGLMPLTTIIGYATLLLEDQAGTLTEQQRQFITIIRSSALKASAAWHNPGDYIRLSHENINWKWAAVQLSEVCDSILSNSFKYINKSNVRVDLSDELAPVKGDRDWLAVALTNLLEPSGGYFYNTEFPSSISAEEVDDKHILIKIRTGLELALDRDYNNIESISFPGNYLSVASMIINKHESQLEFSPLIAGPESHRSQGTEFNFVLPIWRE